MLGFSMLAMWTTRELYLPRKAVTFIPVHVSLVEVQTEGMPLFKAAGWVEPRPTPIRVSALASGVVEELLVVQDQEVKAGQPIARLVATDAELALQQAESMLQLRKAEVQEATAALSAATTNLAVPAHLELPVAEAEAALAAIETELTNLPKQLARAQARRTLAEVDLEARRTARVALSMVDLAQAQSEFDSADAEVQELTDRLPALQQQRAALMERRDASAKRLELKTDEQQAKATAQARLEAARARLAAAEVALAEAKLRLERMTITAPVDGRVLQLLSEPGSQVMVGSSQADSRDGNTVVTMYQPDSLQVRVDVRYEDLPRVIFDQPVMIESPALQSALEGKVLFLTGYANIQKNTLEVKVALENPPSVMKPEMLVDVTFLAPPQVNASASPNEEYHLFVPRHAVLHDDDGDYVWVADLARRIARKQPVEVGTRGTSALVEVVRGLNEASRVIISGRETLRDGDRITPHEESES
jgi:RND family efflux transporter MFP subunit